jgi:hypothetical protein
VEVTNPLEDLLVLRQTTALSPIGVDDRLVRVDVEQPKGPFPDFGFDPEFLLDGGRQTGGRTKPASLVTIDDLDLLDLAHFV